MKFQQGTRRKPLEYEKALLRYWKEHKTFEQSIAARPSDNAFVFYDGPPFLTGQPHHGHLLISTVKDAVARYQTMKGKRVERRWGWDCHGLPAEVFVEKQLGIANKKEIGTKISVADYVKACRVAMVKTGTEWEDTIERLGRWVEFKGAYKTMDVAYMESVWWAFKELYEKGKIYEGEKVLPYCTKDATPISKSEVAMENSYKVDTDPSVFVYFQLEDADEYVLTWTTTPWTLPANVAIAVNESLEYSLVEYNAKKMYVASNAIKKVFTDEKHRPLAYKIIKKVKGSSLVGKKYHPLFENRGPEAHRILAADFVTADDGTGIVHEAPAYGEEDHELCKVAGVPIVSIVDENGHYTEGRWQGQNIWEVNKEIAKTLVSENKALKVEYIKHEYPHCHRCNTKLMYRAHPSWFMDVQAQKSEMLVANKTTSWVPAHLKTGRFKHIIESAPDWNLSRDRYWATPIPVWRGVRSDGTQVIKVIGSYDEFERLTGKKLDDYHLPNVMDIEFEYDGVTLKHIGKVLDCWFESGSMPFAQFHYPFENKQEFENSFPADFIIEAIDQTRGWFYALTAVNVGLFGKSPFKNLICTGFINAADGKKLSKKLKNYTDPMELMDKYSVDSFRLLLLQSPLLNGEDFKLQDKDVADVSRKLAMVWNMYDFFTMYASVDGWEWDGQLKDPYEDLNNPLDQWIVARLYQLSNEVDAHMKHYDVVNATKLLLPFIDDASNWYIRRSRKRFWKSDNDVDKATAYRTLHFILVQLSIVMAPFTPFLAEELYQKLTGGESVHLLDWPDAKPLTKEHLTLIAHMADVRFVITDGLSKRAAAGIKVRQPLASATLRQVASFYGTNDFDELIKEELNVKTLSRDTRKVDPKKTVLKNIQENNYPQSDWITMDTEITPELRCEGVAREVIRHVQNARKNAGLQVEDRIHLSVETENATVQAALKAHIPTINAETLARDLQRIAEPTHTEIVKINGSPVTITLSKAE